MRTNRLRANLNRSSIQINSRAIVAVVVCLVIELGVLSVGMPSAMGQSASRPNVIFIMADDLGYGHLGCYGQQKIQTPCLDKMADEGLRFTQAYAGCCVCASSRSVLMTGLHMGHTPVRGNTGGIALADDDVTVAEVLQNADYETACIGKWGLGEHGTTGVPNKQGFDHFFGYLHQIHAHFYYPEYLWLNDAKFPLAGNSNGQETEYTHDLFVDDALKYLRQQHERPFFLYLPLTIPHYELLVPEDSLAEYRGKFPETPYTGRRDKTGYPNDYATQTDPKAATAAMITRMDRDIGRLLTLLKERGLDDNTLVVFTSDNGASDGPSDYEYFHANGPLRERKGTLYEGGIRVPMIARWPGKVAPGQMTDQICYFGDVMPTLAELAGGKTPGNLDGLSLMPTLLGQERAGRAQKQHDYLYWENPDRESNYAQAIRQGDWKAIRQTQTSPIELYNLKANIGETNDLADQHPDKVQYFETLFQSAHMPAPPQTEPIPPAGQKYQ